MNPQQYFVVEGHTIYQIHGRARFGEDERLVDEIPATVHSMVALPLGDKVFETEDEARHFIQAKVYLQVEALEKRLDKLRTKRRQREPVVMRDWDHNPPRWVAR